MESWRDGTAEEIVGYLRDGVSVSLVGMRGSGRSTTLRRVTDLLRDQGVTVVSAFGVAALRERPLAALAVAGVESPSQAATQAISGAVQALGQQLTPAPAVLVVDDADDLDSVSAGVIAAAYAGQRFPVLTVMRPTGPRQDIGRTLLADLHPSVRVTLEPLRFDQLHSAVHAMLPGSVAPAAVAMIATLSGGLPSLVQAIVDNGRRSGAIVRGEAVWRVRCDLWNARLPPAVEPLLADIGDDEFDALTKLAVIGSLPVPDARKIVEAPVLDRLRDAGLLQLIETADGPQIGVFPPLVGMYLRRAGAPASQLILPDAEPGGMLTHARALILNMRIAEHWYAEVEVLRAVWAAEPTAENAVALIMALDGTVAEPSEFRAVIDGTNLDGTESLWVAHFVSWQAAFMALKLHDQAGARALLARYQKSLPGHAAQLRAADAILQVLAGKIPSDETFAQIALDENPLSTEILQAVRRLALAIEGRMDDALDSLPRRTSEYPYFTETYNVAIGLARVMNGDFDSGVEWALRAMAEAENRLNPGEIQAHAYVAALGLAFAGRIDELHNLLGPALTLNNNTMLHGGYQVGLLELSAAAADWGGQTVYSEALAAQAGAVPIVGPFSSSLLRRGDGAEDGLRGRDGVHLWATSEQRFASGHIAAGVIMAATAVEVLPDPDRVAATLAQARDTQSPFLASLLSYIAAAGDADADALAECVADLRSSGARLHAVKASVTRALVLRQRGELDASIRQAEEAWALAAEFGRPCPGLFHRLGRAVDLSAREREVALQLASGLTPAAIASTLSLSVRTVENYLSSAYRKLGSEGRVDLARAVSTWAA